MTNDTKSFVNPRPVDDLPICNTIGYIHIARWMKAPTKAGGQMLLADMMRVAALVNPPVGPRRLIGAGILCGKVSMPDDDAKEFMKVNYPKMANNLAYMVLIAPEGSLFVRITMFAVSTLMMVSGAIQVDTNTSFIGALMTAAEKGYELGMPLDTVLTEARRLKIC